MEIPASLYSSMRFNFLYVDKYTFQENWAYPTSYIPYCMLRYILKGDAIFSINGEEFDVHEGQVAYIPEGCYLSCYSLSKEFHSSAEHRSIGVFYGSLSKCHQ